MQRLVDVGWRVSQSERRTNKQRLEKRLFNMTNLPTEYFGDIPATVMQEIVTGMQETLPEPSFEEIDHWLNTHNIASTIPGWYERAEEFISSR